MWCDEFPMGALAIAAAAAAEPFKAVLSALLRNKKISRRYDELEMVQSCSVRLADDRVATDKVRLGTLDIVSGGAIAHAVLYALLRVPTTGADVRVIEPEALDLTNLNRYALARRSHVGRLKIDGLMDWARPDFSIRGSAVRLDAATLPSVAPLAQVVLVGVDHIPARWFVQEQQPQWLGVGATAHFTVVVSEHQSGEPCAGCLHPEDDDVNAPIATVSFVSFWAGLLLVTRLLRFLSTERWSANEQVIEVSALRTDTRYGIWFHGLRPLERCPLTCSRLVPIPAPAASRLRR
jgi:molybdopterin/thiamine biosynthesis adenylyltransferase